MEERVQLPGGGFAVVGVSRSGTDRALFLLGLALIVGGCATVAGAWLALTRSVRRALAPIEDIVRVANSITNGNLDRRLPHANPTTDIGRVVVAFNGVLDHLAQALAATRHSDLRSQRFLADAAHQLRRPMAAIQSSAGALLMTTDGLDHEDVLANIVAETARAGSLVRQLLRLARLDAGLDLENERFELCSLVAAELRSLELLNPHLFFRLSGPQNGVWIVADPAAVREALANLLDNARRHARSLVELVVTARCAHVLIEVADDGPGIPRDAVPEVFNRFTTLGDHGGSGLGLPIARQLAKAQGGDLEYVKGRFVLSIPVKETVNGTVA